MKAICPFLLCAVTLILLLFVFGCVGIPTTQPTQKQSSPDETAYNVSAEEKPVEITIKANETTNEEHGDAKTGLDGIESKEILFTTKDKWVIYGTIYYANKSDGVRHPDTAIILLHELGKDRKSFDGIIPRLHAEFQTADIVALDLRGHGKSTNHGYYTNFQVGDYRSIKNDVIALKEELKVLRPTIKKYYIIGASIGGSVALDLAASGESSKIILISPGLAYHDYDISEAGKNYIHEIYMAVGSDDHYSADSARRLYDTSPSDAKELKVYYGINAHGTDLIEATATTSQPLEELIVRWLKR
ncbi:MAG: alpha/beta hydrolase [Candidatus Bilamarchaeaceae archaeon]